VNENCHQIEPLLAAYALNALETDENRQVETHIESCDICLQIVSDYQAISNELLFVQPPSQPSTRIRAKLLAQTATGPKRTGILERFRSNPSRLITVSTLVVALILLVININLIYSTNQLLVSQEELTRQNQVNQTAFALLTYPDSQVAIIDDGEIYGTLVYDPDGQVAILSVWGLESLPNEQDYQVWLIEPDQTRISGGVFQSSDQAEYVTFIIESPNPFDDFSGIGVTVEPAGGSPGPTGPRIFGVEL
jgi:anti-sigma-K factor RskA